MTPIKIQELDEKRFNVLAGHTRSPGAHYCSKEIAWYSNQDETLLDIILLYNRQRFCFYRFRHGRKQKI